MRSPQTTNQHRHPIRATYRLATRRYLRCSKWDAGGGQVLRQPVKRVAQLVLLDNQMLLVTELTVDEHTTARVTAVEFVRLHAAHSTNDWKLCWCVGGPETLPPSASPNLCSMRAYMVTSILS